MGWTTPTDRSSGYVVGATDWNIVEDDLSYLYGDTGWTNVSAFSGTWTGSTQPAYILLGRSVGIRGSVTGGTINTTAFTLPVGYRPSGTWFATTSANNAFAILEISTAGAVIPFVGSTTNFTLNCLFPIA